MLDISGRQVPDEMIHFFVVVLDRSETLDPLLNFLGNFFVRSFTTRGDSVSNLTKKISKICEYPKFHYDLKQTENIFISSCICRPLLIDNSFALTSHIIHGYKLRIPDTNFNFNSSVHFCLVFEVFTFY